MESHAEYQGNQEAINVCCHYDSPCKGTDELVGLLGIEPNPGTTLATSKSGP